MSLSHAGRLMNGYRKREGGYRVEVRKNSIHSTSTAL